MQTLLGILVMKIQILVSLDKYFGDMANVRFGRLTASARRLFRAPGPGYEKTTISIKFKYHSTQRASYRIKRGLIHILSGHVLELIATGIIYGFLNIYKNFKAFTGAKYCQISKAKNHIRYMISKRKIHSTL